MKDDRIEHWIDQRLSYCCILLADQMIIFGCLRTASARRNALFVQGLLPAVRNLIKIRINQLLIRIAQVHSVRTKAGAATATVTLIESSVELSAIGRSVRRSLVQIGLAGLELFQLNFRLRYGFLLAYCITLIVFVQLRVQLPTGRSLFKQPKTSLIQKCNITVDLPEPFTG